MALGVKVLNEMCQLGFTPQQSEYLYTNAADKANDSTITFSRTVTLFVPGGVGNPAGHGSGSVDWVKTSATGVATVTNSAGAAKITVPITGLQIGDVITAFKVHAQIENTADDAGVTLDADMRKVTNVLAAPTDASIGAITQVTSDADVLVASSKTLAAAETIAAGEMIYVLVTATTGAASNAQLLGVDVTVTRTY